MDKLTTTADALIEARQMAQTQRSAVTTVVSSAHEIAEPEPGEVSVVHPRQYATDQHRRHQRSFRRAINAAGIYSYHERFGHLAKSCVDGCKWQQSKNATGGRL